MRKSLASTLLFGAALLFGVPALLLTEVGNGNSALRFGNVAHAQSVEVGKTSLPFERIRRALSVPVDFIQEPLNVRDRLWLTDVQVHAGSLQLTGFVNWKDKLAAPIRGMQAEVKISYRAARPFSTPNAQSYNPLSQLSRIVEVNDQGQIQVALPLGNLPDLNPNSPTRTVLLPGEYVIHLSCPISMQSGTIIDKIINEDPTLLTTENRQAYLKRQKEILRSKNLVDIEQAEQRRQDDPRVVVPTKLSDAELSQRAEESLAQVFREFRTGSDYIPASIAKIYVASDSRNTWIDNGTLGVAQELANKERAVTALEKRIKKYEDDNKKEEDKAKRARIAKFIENDKVNLENAKEQLRIAGGKLTEAEEAVVVRALEAKRKARWDFLNFNYDNFLSKYFDLLYIDLDYQDYKARYIYGANLYFTITSQQLPWERLGADGKPRAKNEADWKKQLKNTISIMVKGDPKTFRKKDGNLPEGVARENRGGKFTEELLKRLHRDVDDFNILTYITKNPEDGKWEIDHAACAEFERTFALGLGLGKTIDPAERNPYLLHGGKDDKVPQTFMERLDALDVSKDWATGVTRYPAALNALREAVVQLSYLPTSYRYTTLNHLKIPDAEVRALMAGADSHAISSLTQIDAVFKRFVGDAEEALDLKRDVFTVERLKSSAFFSKWYWEIGPGRTFDRQENRLNMESINSAIKRLIDEKVTDFKVADGDHDVVIIPYGDAPDIPEGARD